MDTVTTNIVEGRAPTNSKKETYGKGPGLARSDLIGNIAIPRAWRVGRAAIGGHGAEIGGGKPSKEGWPPNWPPKEKGKGQHRSELMGSESALS